MEQFGYLEQSYVILPTGNTIKLIDNPDKITAINSMCLTFINPKLELVGIFNSNIESSYIGQKYTDHFEKIVQHYLSYKNTNSVRGFVLFKADYQQKSNYLNLITLAYFILNKMGLWYHKPPTGVIASTISYCQVYAIHGSRTFGGLNQCSISEIDIGLID